MQLVNQPSILPLALTVNPQVVGGSVPVPPQNDVQTPEPSTVAQGSNRNNGSSTEYPAPSDAELQVRHKRGLKFKLWPKARVPVKAFMPKLPAPPKAPVLPKRPASIGKSSKPKGTKATLDDSKQLVALNKNNAFAPLSAQLAASARSSLLTSAAGSLINIPASVGQHFASQAIIDRIQAQAKMPGAEQVDASGVKTTVDPNATEKQKIEARLEGSEIKLELMVNSILSINEGSDAPAVGKAPDGPTDTGARLVNLERSLGAVEAQMKDVATRYGLIYDPFIAPDPSGSPTDESRMGVIERRQAHMNRMLKRLIKNAEADAEDAE